ncbi:hypothetical protein N7456_007133 [Penicillium angulare]|uniref:Uncharacterized protein n=1 Tax=Penicillium angulare TaxID=116970 RepID=A0A9W9FJ02_9EURO|nr:hypothetical protein N7456_007133 [Penicillium angulare]
MGRKCVTAEEGYTEPILLHPKALKSYSVSDSNRMKQLGHFFDHIGPEANVRISMVELADGVAFVTKEERAQISWTVDDGLV